MRVQPPASRSQRRLPETLVALLLVSGCSLGVFLYVTNVGGRTPVLAVARPVEAGAVLVAEDLTAIPTAAGDGLVTIPADAVREMVGRTARVALSPGVPLIRDVLAERSAGPEGFSLVGLALDPGGYPTPELRAGDLVQVIGTPAVGAAGPASAAEVLVDDAEVFKVSPVGETDRLLVTVAVPEGNVARVADATAQDAARLAVAGG
jgi:hypothetical protein